ncbi:FAD-dependent oxidoreductase [Phenylobacterium sp.]|uniref:FAD-dependent oxidoreductase n=1 Tax=Phenylobacterium sp. TaxID=1871053 RepID=UPI0025CEFF5F|nr:FAD-dependent oxidoreductase [Phenylobacterium sp.]
MADRRALLQRSVALGSLGMLGGCATTGRGAQLQRPAFAAPPPLAPIWARSDRIMNITVCLRPFRAAGPRIEAETVGDKLVVHNYGHGGSGWSLSWGSALKALKIALAGGETDIAVVGCGALGLTAATLAQRAGCRVTIYAKDRLPDARSARATGVWSPDSRIALTSATGPGFAAQWEEMARRSFRIHLQYLGLADRPVEWLDQYRLSDSAQPSPPQPEPMDFAHYLPRIADITPPSEVIPAGQHPFPVARVRRGSTPMFNIAGYGHTLLNDFLLNGGKLEMAEFHAPAELATLRQKVILNCTGYGARALFRDESVVPVRGQIGWLIPQAEVTYGLYYRGVGVISRHDGIAVQYSGPDESYGYNDANEEPDRAEAEAAVATIAPLFAAGSARPRT